MGFPVCTSDHGTTGGLATFDARALHPRPLDSFDALVSPLSKREFVDRFWGREPFFVKRNRAGHFDQVISVDDIDSMLSSMVFYGGEIRVAKDGVVVRAAEITRHDVIDRAKVWSHYRAGATIVFEHLNRKHPGLLRLMSACEQEFRLPFRANAYLTPPASKGFALHYDTHDVIILQVSGSKTWQVHDSPMQLPHDEQSFTPAWAERSRRIAEIVLEPGDVLYLPRGFIHGASSNDETSFHITAGIRSVTLRDVYVTALRRMLLSRPEFRRVYLFPDLAASAASARQALLESLDDVDLLAALRDADLSFLRKRTRPFGGRLAQAVDPPRIESTTALQLSPGAICRLREDAGEVVLHFDRRSIRLPPGARPALEVVASRAVFRAADLPGLEAESRLVLARKLFECRLLDLVDAGEAGAMDAEDADAEDAVEA